MQNSIKIAATLSLAVAMSACGTTPPYNHIDPEARSLIQSVDSVLVSKQNEVGADINVSKLSSYVQGHIVPVLIDVGLNSYRSNKAGKLVLPIRETLSDYDYTQAIKQELNEALVESELGGADGVRILRTEPQGFRRAYIRQSKADAVMFIDVKYAFTPTFDFLMLTSNVMVFPVNEALSPYKERPDTDDIIEYEDNIYRNRFAAAVPVGTDDGSKDENGAAWAAMDEEQLTALMKDGATRLAEQIAFDLSLDEMSEDDTETVSVDNQADPAVVSDLEVTEPDKMAEGA